MTYHRVETQTLNYLSRPHDRRLLARVDSPAAWRGSELDDGWRLDLDESQLDDIEQALEHAMATGKPMEELTAEDFPLESLAALVPKWRDALTEGRGFQVVSGLPVRRWTTEESEVFFWCLGQHLGTPGAQNEDGDLLGHVRDEGDGEKKVRRYRTDKNIAYHCDAADVVGLLCLSTARRGGMSRICSSVTVFNRLLETDPELAALLYEPFLLDAHGNSGIDFFEVTPARAFAGTLRTFYHSDYFRSAHEYETAPGLTKPQQALLDRYDAIANDPENYLEMELAPGDIQLVSNHTIVHSRTEYEDGDAPDEKRHLLRLWLTLGRDDASLAEKAARVREAARLLYHFAGAKVRAVVS